jgi:hypothetical protein
LLIITTNQDELAVAEIVRLEADYIAIRGRQTGVAEVGGGFYFIPYDRIIYLGFQKPVKEADIRKMYETGADGAAPLPTLEPAVALPAEELPPPAEPATPPEPPKSGERPVGSAKAALLERLRARRASGEANRPPSK